MLAWGSNTFGELGNGTHTDSNTPVQVKSLAGVVAIVGGGHHSLALSGGTVWAWGWDGYGQLGPGIIYIDFWTDSTTPVMVSGLTGVVLIGAGEAHSLPVKSDTTAWAWGANYLGQLGNGTNTDSNMPVAVSELTGVVAIASEARAGYHNLALKNDATVWAWGWNNFGQLGNGTNTDSNKPVAVSGLTGAVAIAAGGPHSLALKSDGTMRAWGLNDHGELGNCTNINSNTPVAVRGLTGVTAIGAGADHSLARGNPPPMGACSIDSTPPVIVPTVTGTAGANGWYISDVMVSWSATDPESGIASSSGCGPTTLTANTPGTTLTCSATNGDGLTTSVPVTVKIDQTPPVIVPAVSGQLGANGWYIGNVTVSWSVTDPESAIVSSSGCGSTILTVGTTLNCSATNGAGLSSSVPVTVKIDQTPPVIVPTVTGQLGANGWYIGNVTVSWSFTDPESAIASSTGCGSTTLTAGNTLTCAATNGAGLSSSVPVTVKIDKTPPVISGMPASGCTLWPPNHKMVNIGTVTAADAPSGLAPGSFTVTGTSNEPSDPKDPDIVITANGSGGFVVQLRAERLGTGTGRIYSLTSKATDLAGNPVTATATCTVPHDQGN